MVIDVYSKYGWMKSLRDKKGETVTKAFRSNFKEGRQPQYLWFGKGKEFDCRPICRPSPPIVHMIRLL